MAGKEFEQRIDLVRYSPEYKELWDDFVESSKNGTFLFKRDYMDYHADRFHDRSLIIFRKGRVYCLLPANIKDRTIYSHQGLTYGGLVMSEKCSVEGILEVFEALMSEFHKSGITEFIYKPVPHIYHTLPSEEDLYALFRYGTQLTGRNVSSTIYLPHRLNYSNIRRTSLRRAVKSRLAIDESDDLESFWKVLEQNLTEKYGATPVHSLEEMEKLKSLFPENIKLFTACEDKETVGGILVYVTPTVVHTQYISASGRGKETGAIDAIMDHLIQRYALEKLYFDMGTSNEDSGRVLNEALIYQKQGFGGRAICYDTYRLFL